MHIEKLEIKGFGKITELFLKLNKGINVVYGENESGKSSVQEFIIAVLFGIKGGRTSKEGELPPLKKYRPWSCNNYSGFIEYRLENGEFYRAGRNFENNTITLCDSLYNDIACQFTSAKDKVIKFAEKQLGVDSICFERTAFVRQMDTIIGSGNRELFSRLSNIYQSGNEDISYKKAEEAIKKALLKYIGTERSTTRPLDKLAARLKELEKLKNDYIEKRRQAFSLEDQLKELNDRKSLLEADKQVLDLLKQAVQLKISTLKNKAGVSECAHVYENAKGVEKELEDITGRISDLKFEKDSLDGIAQFGEEEIRKVVNEFNELILLKEQRARVNKELADKNNELERASSFSSGQDSLRTLSGNLEEQIIQLDKEIDSLQLKCSKNTVNEHDDKIQKLKLRETGTKYGFIASFVLIVVSSMLGFSGIKYAYWLDVPAAAVSIGLIYKFLKENKELENVRKAKKIAWTELKEWEAQLVEKRKNIEDIYASAGAKNYEDFIKLRLKHESKVETIMALNNGISKLESEINTIERRISIMSALIAEKLVAAGISESSGETLSREHIEAFTYGVNRYKHIEVELIHEEQRYKDKAEMLESLLNRVQCQSREDVHKKIKELELKYENEKCLLQDMFRSIEKICEESWLNHKYTQYIKGIAYDEVHQEEIYIEQIQKIEKEYEGLCSQFDDIKLQIREGETFLKSIEIEDDMLQSLEEEMFALRNSKQDLEHREEALKVALEILQQTSLEIQRDYAPVLSEKMSAIVSKMTGGRYRDIRVDSNLALKALVPETRDISGITSLSGGTADQMYLAMRIAMAQILDLSSEKLPLICDEIFSQYDDCRTRETMEYLKGLSEHRQVIIFTCKEREAEIAKEIFKGDLNLISLI